MLSQLCLGYLTGAKLLPLPTIWLTQVRSYCIGTSAPYCPLLIYSFLYIFKFLHLHFIHLHFLHLHFLHLTSYIFLLDLTRSTTKPFNHIEDYNHV